MNEITPKSPRDLARACRDMFWRLQDAAKLVDLDLTGGPWLDARKVLPEVRGLKESYEQLQFSPAYKEWSARRRGALVSELSASADFRKAAQNWATVDTDSRLAVIRAMGNRLQAIFSENDRLFLSKKARLNPFDQPSPPGDSDTNYFERGRATDGMTGWRCTVGLNVNKDAGFDNFYKAMDSAYHEYLHTVHFSLSGYFNHCQPDKHPLGADMEMLRYGFGTDYPRYARFQAVYYALPWERDAHHQSKLFTRELRAALHRSGP